MNQAIKVISSTRREYFEEQYAEFCKNNTVFATHTHVTIHPDGDTTYTAFVFHRVQEGA